MGKITDITRQKRNRSRVSVYIDGEFACGLDEVTAISSRIAIGDEITCEELKKLVFSSESASAFERAVTYLSDVPRARREVYTYLSGKGYDRDVINDVMKKLDGYGYINDRAYAEAYISVKKNKYGAFRIAAELKNKGVDSAVIEGLLDDYSEDAVTAARKYLRSHPSATSQKLRRFLAGRGFSWDAISDALSEVSDELLQSDGDGQYDD